VFDEERKQKFLDERGKLWGRAGLGLTGEAGAPSNCDQRTKDQAQNDSGENHVVDEGVKVVGI
jgi:hypothetical protein